VEDAPFGIPLETDELIFEFDKIKIQKMHQLIQTHFWCKVDIADLESMPMILEINGWDSTAQHLLYVSLLSLDLFYTQ
jgi:hypothetical protein